MSGWDPTAWFSGDLDPGNVGKNKAKVTNPNAPLPTVTAPTQAPDVTQQTNTSAAPKMAVPTEGPAQTTIAGTQGPTGATVNTSGVQNLANANAYTGAGQANQNALMHQLAGQANGTAPSVAGLQLQQGQNANLAATMAQLASARGAANPLLQRQAMQQGSDAQAQTNQQAAINRLQEQQGAQSLLGNVAGQSSNLGLAARAQDLGLRQQDLGTAQQNAAMQQQAALAGYQGNLQTNLSQAGINAGNASALFGAQQNANQNNAGFQQGQNNLGFQYANLGQQAQLANQNAFNQNQALGQQGQIANQNTALSGQKLDQAAQIANANIKQANAAASAKAIGGEMNAVSQLAGSGAAQSMMGGGGGGGQATAGPDAASVAPMFAAMAAQGGIAPDPFGSFGSALTAPDTDKPKPITGEYIPGYAHGGQTSGYAAGTPSVQGDSTKNDKVPTWISPGEVVLPRTVVNAKDPIEAFKTFMSTVHNKPIGQGHEPDDALRTVMEAQAKIRSAK